MPTPSGYDGLDFYEEVSRFEIEFIKQALKSAEGHQTKAVQLLNLKATTLNVMIKRYNIQVAQMAGSEVGAQSSSPATRAKLTSAI